MTLFQVVTCHPGSLPIVLSLPACIKQMKVTSCGRNLWAKPKNKACHIYSHSIGKKPTSRPYVISRDTENIHEKNIGKLGSALCSEEEMGSVGIPSATLTVLLLPSGAHGLSMALVWRKLMGPDMVSHANSLLAL